MSIVRIPLNSRKYPGLFAIIDEEDYELVLGYSWFPKVYPDGRIYTKAYNGTSRKNNTYILMHRLILGCGPNDVVDHIDGDGLNNRRVNLRIATTRQNARNQRLRSSNTSGFKGIRYHKRDKRWVARIKVNYEEIRIGAFMTKEEAARAYDDAAVQYFGEFALTNESMGLFKSEER